VIGTACNIGFGDGRADVLFLILCSLVIFCSGLKVLLSAIVVIFIFGNFIGLTFRLKNINSPTERQAVNVIGHPTSDSANIDQPAKNGKIANAFAPHLILHQRS
jgi:hypothetical protein